MLSLVICSVNPDYLGKLKENIAGSIGVEYELLVIDNRHSKLGLCSIYNQLAGQAKFDIICFMHEDILFETMNWGKRLVEVFERDSEIGVVGVAGGKYKAKNYSGWYAGKLDLDCFNITHLTNGKRQQMIQPAKGTEDIHEVVCIDGVFMACRRGIWLQVGFDEYSLKGFHFYDIDFSLRAARISRVIVYMGIDILHITTGGDYGDRWVESAIPYHEKHKLDLPFFKGNLTYPNLELEVARHWLDWLKKDKISLSNKLKWIKNQQLYRYPFLWYSILRFLLYEPFGLSFIHQKVKRVF